MRSTLRFRRRGELIELAGFSPAVIAAATVAEILVRDEALRAAQGPAAILGRTA